MFREGVAERKTVADIDRSIRERVSAEGLEDVFMGTVRFIGHGVGLELDELPVIFGKYRGIVEDGNVVALEPKFVFNDGTVGYETTYAVENGTCEPMNRFETGSRVL